MSIRPEYAVVVFALHVIHYNTSLSNPVASITLIDFPSKPPFAVNATPHSIDNLDIPILTHSSSRNLLPLGPHQILDGPLFPLLGGFVKPA